jgi:hypothetical protein
MNDSLSGASDYRVFGLRVRSEIPLPELFPATGEAVADVTIRRGSLVVPGSTPGLRAEGAALMLTIPDVARYRIEGGHTIIVDPEPDVPERNLRLFLLGSAFGALLHQRGLLPLHANAVEIDGCAVAFMGASGEGKSTLAAWFHDHGHRIIADDVCVVGFDGERHPYAAPGLPRLRLWREALELMGRETSGYHRSYLDPVDEFEKFDVPIASQSATRCNVPLAALYLLDRADRCSVVRMSGIEAAEAIFANTYRGTYVSAAGNHEGHWQTSIKLVRSAPVYRASREWGLAKLDGQCRRLLDHVAAHLESSDGRIGAVR